MTFVRQKDLLAEIWKSKLSYCHITDADFIIPDIIVSDLSDVSDADTTVRHDTHDHIPLAALDEIRKGKFGHLEGDIRFSPFILYRCEQGPDGLAFRETARSHWFNGEFNPAPPRGMLTHRLAEMLMIMVTSYARKGSWRNYSYVDEMSLEALLNLCGHVLKFDEAKTSNTHAYITRMIQTTFIRVLRKQKKEAAIRDQLLMINGMPPSIGAQLESSSDKKKVGRPRKIIPTT